MRVRNRPGAAEMLAAHPNFVISDPTLWKENGMNCLKTIIQSTLRLVWGKASSSLEWQKPILKSIILSRNAGQCCFDCTRQVDRTTAS